MKKCKYKSNFKIGSDIDVSVYFSKKDKTKTVCDLYINNDHNYSRLHGVSICDAQDTYDSKIGKELALDHAIENDIVNAVNNYAKEIKTYFFIMSQILDTISHRFSIEKVDMKEHQLYFLKLLRSKISYMIDELEN